MSGPVGVAHRPLATAVKPTPRVVEFVTIKRNAPLAGRSYGHWWLEMDGIESYGWWPGSARLRTRDVLVGGPGVLNGVGTTDEGRPTRDPNHGLAGDYEFHPVLMVPSTDDEVRHAIRDYAAAFRGDWSGRYGQP